MSVGSKIEEQDHFSLFDLSLLTQNGMESWLVTTINRCAEWFRASGASVFLMDSDGVIRIKAKCGKQSKIPDDAMIEVGEGIAGTVLVAGIPRIVGNPADDPLLSTQGVESRDEIASSMVVPLIGLSGERVGVMNFSRTGGEVAFCEEDLAQAAHLGAHVAMAIGNARLVVLLQKALAAQDRKADQLVTVLASVPGSVHIFDSSGFIEGGNVQNALLAEEARKVISSTLGSGEKAEIQVFDHESDQTWILSVCPLRSGGGVLTIQETTSFQRAQDEAARLRRLAEIGQMTAAIAHELRNPLTGIRGAAQLILSDPTYAYEPAQIILEEAVKMNTLCDDFLEVSRPLKLRLAPKRLSEVVRRVKDLWSAEFKEKGIGLDLCVIPSEVEVAIDSKSVEQIVHNLIRNALQASHPGGRVELRVENGALSVTDDGEGMDESTRLRLFAPFFTTKAHGTGLGLCNVRRIVDAHGGSVEVWSKVGEGTKFEISFKKSAA